MEEDGDVPQMEGEVQEEHTTAPAKDIHGYYRACIEHLFASLWSWRVVRDIY